MSASDPNSKIDLLDTAEVTARKIKKANAPPKQVEENGLLAFVEHVLFPASSLLDGQRTLKVERGEGVEPLVYSDMEKLKEDYIADTLTPQLVRVSALYSLGLFHMLTKSAQTRYQHCSPSSSRPHPGGIHCLA